MFLQLKIRDRDTLSVSVAFIFVTISQLNPSHNFVTSSSLIFHHCKGTGPKVLGAVIECLQVVREVSDLIPGPRQSKSRNEKS